VRAQPQNIGTLDSVFEYWIKLIATLNTMFVAPDYRLGRAALTKFEKQLLTEARDKAFTCRHIRRYQFVLTGV
jgi:hypothetical protein